MQTNTVNTSGSLNGLTIGGISLSLLLGTALVISTWNTNRYNKKLMTAQMKKLESEGFLPDDDILDKAFSKIEKIAGYNAPPIPATPPTPALPTAENSFDGMENKDYSAPNLGGGFGATWGE